MAMAMTCFVMAVSLVLTFGISSAAVYKVGDSAGWTTIGNIDYKKWALTKTFRIGDVIIFQYNSQFHNVMRVSHAHYRACNASSPMASYATGNDSITITSGGHHFFFCGVPGHCQAGQKVDINVARIGTSMPPTPSPTPTPTTPIAKVPGPSSSNACTHFIFFVPLMGNLAVFLLLVPLSMCLLT